MAQIRRLKVAGFAAWMLWLLVHIYFLIGFRNRAIVMFQWAWSYLTFQRGARLITYNDRPSRSAGPVKDLVTVESGHKLGREY